MSSAKVVILTGDSGTDKAFLLPSPHASSRIVLFFGGDQLEAIRTSQEVLALQDPKNVCAILAERFPGHHILAVAANRIEAGFACYDHWLTGTNVEGDPSAYVGASFRASSHLASLLVQLRASALKGLFPALGSPVTLVLAGFSKGGVVLNQLLHEMAAASPVDHSVLHATTVTGVVAAHGAGPHVPLHAPTGALGAPAGAHKPHGQGPSHTPSRSGSTPIEERTLVDWIHTDAPINKGPSERPAPPPAAFEVLKSIGALHYLDVGLNVEGAYVTSEAVATEVADFQRNHGAPAAAGDPAFTGFRVFLHGTPRQWLDPVRPWLGAEKEASARAFEKAGLPVHLRWYMREEEPTLLMHFVILKTFDPLPGGTRC